VTFKNRDCNTYEFHCTGKSKIHDESLDTVKALQDIPILLTTSNIKLHLIIDGGMTN
jgi:hypothetical protein